MTGTGSPAGDPMRNPAAGGQQSPAPGSPQDPAPGDTPMSGPGKTLTFMKDGAPVAVDFSRWGTPAYYQKTSGAWRLVIVANEVLGDQKRYVSLTVRANGGGMLVPGSYDCSGAKVEGAMGTGELVYSEAGMNRVWRSGAGMPCTITIEAIGEVGGRLQGTFTGTLAASKGADAPVSLTAGLFDVTRKQFGSNAN